MQIRKAKLLDSEDILNWRNDFSSRKMFVENYLISKQEHKDWYTNKLKDKGCYMFIGEKDKNKVGIVRFNYNFNDLNYLVSINVNPKMRGLGLSYDLLSLSIRKVPHFKKSSFVAAIKKENIISKKIFTKCGFKLKLVEDKYDYYLLKF